ncbi:hypothetical protein TD95_000846 [Thielaviopsis punctulata]|uniref:H/ACA ribonucleoprotein complex non-core subunit NAF1 n=1 Tax=Thielaviopsis punctulata TaxID=72032 RepID=A0A0F4ZIZ5_9PEZI|nr:hypothetical protein TD95_000846 [Thielaviopsis punctulata]
MSAVPEPGVSQPTNATVSAPLQSEDVQMGDELPMASSNPNDAMDTSTGPSITSALEAMLDDFDPMPALEELPTTQSESQKSLWTPAAPEPTVQDSAAAPSESPEAFTVVSKAEDNESLKTSPVTSKVDNDRKKVIPQSENIINTSEPHNTESLSSVTENAMDTTDAPVAQPSETNNAESTAPETQQENPEEGDHPEWEIDSSPYESSSDSSSDSDSDSGDSEDEKYELLGIEETARILMKAEGESDDEGDGSGKAGKQMRTKNEIDEQYAPRPDVVITQEMKIEPLGVVEHIVENTIVVRGFTPAEYQVLDSGSILCLADRTVVGAISEPLGKVQQPMYLVGFQSATEITELGLRPGTKLYYSIAHANYVFTSALKNLKGSDASNIHDEEVAADEIEFSDDEKEAEYKRMKKQKRREKNGKAAASDAAPRSGLRNEVKRDDAGLNYDDKAKASSSGSLNYDDGSYRRLTRPPGFGTGQSQSNLSDGRQAEEPKHRDTGANSGGYHGNNSGRGRGGRGGRGGYSARGGRGGNYHHNDTRDSRSSHSAWDNNKNTSSNAHAQQSHSHNYQAHSQPVAQPQYAPTYQPQPPLQIPQPSASGSYYTSHQGAAHHTAPPPALPFGNPGSFMPFPAPPPPNANPASIPPLPQFSAAVAAAALASGQMPMIPGLAMPHQQQHQQQQHQQQPPQYQQQQPAINAAQAQQTQVNPTLAAAMANPAFMAFLAQASAFAQNQNPSQGHQ